MLLLGGSFPIASTFVHETSVSRVSSRVGRRWRFLRFTVFDYLCVVVLVEGQKCGTREKCSSRQKYSCKHGRQEASLDLRAEGCQQVAEKLERGHARVVVWDYLDVWGKYSSGVFLIYLSSAA